MTESLLEGSVVVVLVHEFFVNTYFQEQNLKVSNVMLVLN
jgi:hypothetical protein